MMSTPRSRRFSVLTLTFLIAGSAAVLAPAAVPAAPAAPPATAAASVPALAATSEAAAGNLTTSLTALAAGTPSPNREEMHRAFTDAGFPGESVEISLDITPTGLAVDSIRGAVAEEGECLIGEVRGGSVEVLALPVLDSGFCFVGDQR